MACLASRIASMLEDVYRTRVGTSQYSIFLLAVHENVLTFTRRSRHLSHALSVVPS